jgi:hypothetical protein
MPILFVLLLVMFGLIMIYREHWGLRPLSHTMGQLWHNLWHLRLGVTLISLFWLATLWASEQVGDRLAVPMTLLLPVLAGILVGWWRQASIGHRYDPGPSAVVGALVLALDIVVAYIRFVLGTFLGWSIGLPFAGRDAGWLAEVWERLVWLLNAAGAGFLLGVLGWGIAVVLNAIWRHLIGRSGPAMPTDTP